MLGRRRVGDFLRTFFRSFAQYKRNERTAETKFEPSTNRVYRWYCSNPIRFQKSLKIEIQNEDWVECFNDFTSVSFWYQEGAQGVTLAPLAERVRESMPELQQEESK